MDSDLFPHFRGFLILGRFLGLVPIAGVFERSHKDLKRSFNATLSNVLCILLIAFSMGVAIRDTIGAQMLNPTEIANSIGNPIFFAWGFFMYSYFLYRRQQLLRVFESWARCDAMLNYTREDKTLKRTIILVSVVMFTSTILENAVLHMDYFVVFDDINGHTKKHGIDPNRNVSVLQMYYWRAHYSWNKYIGNYPTLAIPAFLSDKVVIYGANYVDVLMSLFARALYFKFYMLNEVAYEILLKPMLSLGKPDNQLDHNAWSLLPKDHDSLCDLLNEMNAFFSPVIFVSFTVNLYFFCMQVERLEKRLNFGPKLGFNGLGCFTVTKPFMLSMINVVFTVEIVLLQGLSVNQNRVDSHNKCP